MLLRNINVDESDVQMKVLESVSVGSYGIEVSVLFSQNVKASSV